MHAPRTIVQYAQCWEDADILVEALDVQPGQTCLSIVSGGDNTLALVGQGPGRVLAVDRNPLQLHCLELRMAAYRELNHGQLLELIGSRPSNRREALYSKCRGALSPEARGFWDSQASQVRAGIGSAGKFERYLYGFRRYIVPWALGEKTISSMLAGGTVAQRMDLFQRRVNTRRFRAAFSVFFSARVMSRLGRDRAAFRFVDGGLSARLFERTRYALTTLDPAQNPYLTWILSGQHRDALPLALRPEMFDPIRENLGSLELHCLDLSGALERTGSNEIDHFNLSDVFEYLSEADTGILYESMLRVGRIGGRVAHWNMMVPRGRPDRLTGHFRSLEAESKQLHARDKAFFYSAFLLESIQ